MRQEKVKVGIVGLGKMGFVHASLLSAMEDVELVALCDKGMLIRKVCERIFPKAHVVSDLVELAGLDLDAVFVTTPISSHYLIVKKAYANHVTGNFFVEKTLASNYEESRDLCELISSESVNMVGYMKRYAVTFRKAKNLLDQGAIGEAVSFEANGYSSDFSGAATDARKSSSRGGVLSDLGAHIIDVVLWYFGDFKVNSVRLSSLDPKGGSEDSARFGAMTAKGLKGIFDVSWCHDEYRMPEFILAIQGTKGVLKVNDDEIEVTLQNGRSQKWCRASLNDNVPFLSGGSEYFREDQHFITSIVSGRSSEPDFKTASRVDQTIQQVKEEFDADKQQEDDVASW